MKVAGPVYETGADATLMGSGYVTEADFFTVLGTYTAIPLRGRPCSKSCTTGRRLGRTASSAAM